MISSRWHWLFECENRESCFLGVSLLPGVRSCVQTLSRHCSIDREVSHNVAMTQLLSDGHRSDQNWHPVIVCSVRWHFDFETSFGITYESWIDSSHDRWKQVDLILVSKLHFFSNLYDIGTLTKCIGCADQCSNPTHPVIQFKVRLCVFLFLSNSIQTCNNSSSVNGRQTGVWMCSVLTKL